MQVTTSWCCTQEPQSPVVLVRLTPVGSCRVSRTGPATPCALAETASEVSDRGPARRRSTVMGLVRGTVGLVVRGVVRGAVGVAVVGCGAGEGELGRGRTAAGAVTAGFVTMVALGVGTAGAVEVDDVVVEGRCAVAKVSETDGAITTSGREATTIATTAPASAAEPRAHRVPGRKPMTLTGGPP